MASTVGMYSKVNPVEKNTLRGVCRSRFSFHFMTQRTRRWLLVQWVSVPVAATGDEQAIERTRFLSRRSERPTFHTLLNDYTIQAWLRRSV